MAGVSLVTGIVRATVSPAGDLQVEIPGTGVGRYPAGRHVSSAAVGDVALLGRDGTGAVWVIALLGTTVGTVTPPDAGTSIPGPRPRDPVVVTPAWSGTWRGSSWRTDTGDLVCGDLTGGGINTGVSDFGGALRAGWAAFDARLVSREGGPAAPTMILTGPTDRASAPAVLATTPGPTLTVGVPVTWPVPAGWVTVLLSGVAAGLGISSAGSAAPYLRVSPISITATPA